jgi:hypothetical protein
MPRKLLFFRAALRSRGELICARVANPDSAKRGIIHEPQKIVQSPMKTGM